MGINGLLKLLESAKQRRHVSAYAHQRVAVDAYCWLHKAVYSCSTELALGVPTDRWLAYCLRRVEVLLHNHVTPVMVFDGGHLPMKRAVEIERRRKRDESKKKGLELYRQENYKEAEAEFGKSVDVTTDMAMQLIRKLQDWKVECIVAPYEADAQLAYLAITGYVHAVVTEDSDLLAFAAPRVMFKMEKTGDGEEIALESLRGLDSPSFTHWTPEMFRHMCILMGCDYTPPISGLGPKKAHALVAKFRGAIDKVLVAIKLDTKAFSVPDGYEETFKQADLTFLHQRVYDPLSKRMVPLTPIPAGLNADLMDFLGPLMPQDVCYKIANAIIDPCTKEPYPLRASPPTAAASQASASPSGPRPSTFGRRGRGGDQRAPLPVQRNLVTRYFAPVTDKAKGSFRPPRPVVDLTGDAPDPARAADAGEDADGDGAGPAQAPVINGSLESVPDSPSCDEASADEAEPPEDDDPDPSQPAADPPPRPAPGPVFAAPAVPLSPRKRPVLQTALVPGTPSPPPGDAKRPRHEHPGAGAPGPLAASLRVVVTSRFFGKPAAAPGPASVRSLAVAAGPCRSLDDAFAGAASDTKENSSPAAPPSASASPRTPVPFRSPNVAAARLTLAARPALATHKSLLSPYFAPGAGAARQGPS